jgi:hypothetical protein
MAELFLAAIGVLMVTFAVMRVAACRYARHTRDLIERGVKDIWP